MRATLKKYEIIRSKIQIDNVFTKGQGISKYPLLLKYTDNEVKHDSPVKVVFSVSKKKFSSAVDRNRIKRLMREVYRKNKSTIHEWVSDNNRQLLIALIYTGKTILSYEELEKKLILILQTLIKSDGKANR